jgi:hypothetical protein
MLKVSITYPSHIDPEQRIANPASLKAARQFLGARERAQARTGWMRGRAGRAVAKISRQGARVDPYISAMWKKNSATAPDTRKLRAVVAPSGVYSNFCTSVVKAFAASKFDEFE